MNKEIILNDKFGTLKKVIGIFYVLFHSLPRRDGSKTVKILVKYRLPVLYYVALLSLEGAERNHENRLTAYPNSEPRIYRRPPK